MYFIRIEVAPELITRSMLVLKGVIMPDSQQRITIIGKRSAGYHLRSSLLCSYLWLSLQANKGTACRNTPPDASCLFTDL
jgi:hypothetical protein